MENCSCGKVLGKICDGISKPLDEKPDQRKVAKIKDANFFMLNYYQKEKHKYQDENQ